MLTRPSRASDSYWCNKHWQQHAFYLAFCNANISRSENLKLHDQFAAADNTELRFCGNVLENVWTRKASHPAAAAHAGISGTRCHSQASKISLVLCFNLGGRGGVVRGHWWPPNQRWESKSRVTFSAERLQKSHSLLEKSDSNDSIDMCTACVRRSEKLSHLEKKQEVTAISNIKHPPSGFLFFPTDFWNMYKKGWSCRGSLSNYVHRIIWSMMGMIGCGHRLSEKLLPDQKDPQNARRGTSDSILFASFFWIFFLMKK
jgi:hypothetical protein